jgi:uncharacterized protein
MYSGTPSPPDDIFGRDHEWRRLVEFVEAPIGECLVGLVYGRRRQGKTMLLERLCEAYGGFYWQAEETESGENLASLSDAYSAWVGGPGPVRFQNWNEAFVALTAQRAKPTPIVIDEIGRVIAKAPVVPSQIQRALSPTGPASRDNRSRLILCGSAFGEMRRLIDGTAPLRGRASLELVIQPFDFRKAADFWHLSDNPDAAFEMYCYMGGTPAYVRFASGERPRHGNVREWVFRRLLDPSSVLFREGRIVIAEDGELKDQLLYWGLLGSVAHGARRWSDLEAALGAKRGSVMHALRTTMDAGWIERRNDPLRDRRTTYELREPIVRFHRLVIEPNEQRLLRGVPPERVWNDVEAAVASLICGPQLEQMAYDWALVHGSNETFGGVVSEVGPTSLSRAVTAADGSEIRDIDLAAVEHTSNGGRRLLALGEVKAVPTRVGPPLLDRLDRAVASLERPRSSRVAVNDDVRRVIVSRSGFTNELRRLADSRPEVVLIDLHRLYHGA